MPATVFDADAVAWEAADLLLDAVWQPANKQPTTTQMGIKIRGLFITVYSLPSRRLSCAVRNNVPLKLRGSAWANTRKTFMAERLNVQSQKLKSKGAFSLSRRT